MEGLLRKTVGSEQRQSRREALWVSTSKATVAGLSKPFITHIIPPCATDSGHRAAGFNACPAKCQFLVSSLLATPAFFSWNENVYSVSVYLENL